MDATDKKILNILQSEFPLTERPFLTVAKKFGLSEEEVISRIRRLKNEGVIRRIGAVFAGDKLGRVSTLCAACVPEKKLEEFIGAVNAFPGVTHNYLRANKYNVWFTLNAASRKEIEAFLSSLKEQTGIGDILDMPAVKTYKINATFAA